MKVKELAAYLAGLNQDAECVVWSWFADGEHLYAPHLPIDEPKPFVSDGIEHIIVGCFDNCPADMVQRKK